MSLWKLFDCQKRNYKIVIESKSRKEEKEVIYAPVCLPDQTNEWRVLKRRDMLMFAALRWLRLCVWQMRKGLSGCRDPHSVNRVVWVNECLGLHANYIISHTVTNSPSQQFPFPFLKWSRERLTLLIKGRIKEKRSRQ